MEWLLFLPQLPATPSTLRVTVWRKMRAEGGLGVQNGIWILPQTPAHAQFVQGLLAYLERQGATGYVFTVQALSPEIESRMLDAFRRERDEEYAEVIERCCVMLDELVRESGLGKFTFAELEEAEEDLAKLEGWLGKIAERDFASDLTTTSKRLEAFDHLDQCRAACQNFAARVYAAAGIQPPEDSLPASDLTGGSKE